MALDVQAFRKWHRPFPSQPGGAVQFCENCCERWPCTTDRLCDEFNRQAAEIARLEQDLRYAVGEVERLANDKRDASQEIAHLREVLRSVRLETDRLRAVEAAARSLFDADEACAAVQRLDLAPGEARTERYWAASRTWQEARDALFAALAPPAADADAESQ